jgi:hypothetical protein
MLTAHYLFPAGPSAPSESDVSTARAAEPRRGLRDQPPPISPLPTKHQDQAPWAGGVSGLLRSLLQRKQPPQQPTPPLQPQRRYIDQQLEEDPMRATEPPTSPLGSPFSQDVLDSSESHWQPHQQHPASREGSATGGLAPGLEGPLEDMQGPGLESGLGSGEVAFLSTGGSSLFTAPGLSQIPEQPEQQQRASRLTAASAGGVRAEQQQHQCSPGSSQSAAINTGGKPPIVAAREAFCRGPLASFRAASCARPHPEAVERERQGMRGRLGGWTPGRGGEAALPSGPLSRGARGFALALR